MTNSEALQSFQDAIEAFAHEYVANPSYRPRFPQDPKIIHDPLWGTIRLQPWEVALLDLPLFQRLRQIRQTSLVNYVFPGCNHSRFEHTLGVVHQTQKLADAINGQGSSRPFNQDAVNNLRLAALFHDCGHGCFSHISEDIFQYCPDMQAATAEDGPYPSGHAHEVLSSMILLSKPVREFIDVVEAHYKSRHISFDVDAAAGWIVGQPAGGCESLRYLAQVVNGPFDADKLDYIFRDAHYSGLPIALDLDRLWASCTVGEWTSRAKKTSVLTLHRGSTTPLEQILFNKTNLFAVVYQHPKVRAAEAMFQGVVEYCREKEIQIRKRDLALSTDFLWVTDNCFFAEALIASGDAELHEMIHDLLYRRHYLRALTISRETVEADGNEANYQRLLTLNHRNNLEVYLRRRELAGKIWERAGKPCRRCQVWLDLPPSPPKGEADRIIVRMPGNTLQKLGDQFSLDFWADQYINHKWRGHVFCPPAHQQIIHKAAIEVIDEEYGVKFNELARTLSHVPTSG